MFGAANTSRTDSVGAGSPTGLPERLLVFAPNNPFVMNNLAEVLLDQGCPARAEQLLNTVSATGDVAAAHADIAAALADTRTRAAALRAQQVDGPACDQ